MVRVISGSGSFRKARLEDSSQCGLSFGHGGMNEAIPSGATLIHLAEDRGRLEASLCLCVDRFLD